MYKGKIFESLITSVSEDGAGVAKDDGYTVFVKGAVPGDFCEIEVTKANKNYGFGKILRLISSSPHRKQSECRHFLSCGGCTLLHTDYACQLAIKRDKVCDALSRIGGFSVKKAVDTINPDSQSDASAAFSPDDPPDTLVFDVSPSVPYFECRNKTVYPVSGKPGDVKIGFFTAKSHSVVDVSRCLIENPASRAIVSVVRSWMNKYKIPPFDEENFTGLIRNIYVRCGEEALLVLVSRKPNIPHFPELKAALLALDIKISGIVVNVNNKKTNTVLGDSDVILYGVSYINAKIKDLTYKVHYRSFFQVNSFTTPKLYEKTLELCALTGKETVFDIYCGIGTISLFLARQAKSVIGIEVTPEAIEDAKENSRINGINNVSFYCGRAEDIFLDLVKNGYTADVVVVDPPRKGCDEKLLSAIGEMLPKRIVYVSCNVSTLSRDAKILSEKYGYKLVCAYPFDQFPHTTHVETVCLLSKLKSKEHIYVDINLDELDLTKAEKKVTYQEIKDYVLEHSGLKVSQLNIAQVKRKCGIIERENFNKPKSEDAKQPQCPPEKETAIMEALRYFGMIG